MTTTTDTQAARGFIDNAEGLPAAGGHRLQSLEVARRHLAAEIDAEVRAMREAGESWARIGAWLGVTKQAAQQRYGALVIDSGRP